MGLNKLIFTHRRILTTCQLVTGQKNLECPRYFRIRKGFQDRHMLSIILHAHLSVRPPLPKHKRGKLLTFSK